MAIDAVLAHRKQVDSCIILALYACEHVFRSLQRLPQALPSSRKALDILNSELMGKLQSDARTTDIGYAIAESQVVDGMVHTIGGLVQVNRSLLGTRA